MLDKMARDPLSRLEDCESLVLHIGMKRVRICDVRDDFRIGPASKRCELLCTCKQEFPQEFQGPAFVRHVQDLNMYDAVVIKKVIDIINSSVASKA